MQNSFKAQVINYMDYVTRIHLNIKEAPNRRALIDYCLNSPKQCLAIGWSSVYDGKTNINNYEDFYSAIKEKPERINHVLNVFRNTKPDDLFWTRDLNGDYWICRVLGKAEAYYSEEFKTGAIIPVKAYKFGMQVPGEIKASFNRPRGGTAQEIKDASIVEYSKYIYNKLSGSNYFEYNETKGDLLDNLPDFDLEELVICYLQIVKNYYVLSNSIANKSTTIKMECELTSRNKESLQKAVVRLKAEKAKESTLWIISFTPTTATLFIYSHRILKI